MTEPYSSIGLTSEQYKAFKDDTSLNTIRIPLIKPNFFRAFQQDYSIKKLELKVGQKPYSDQ